MVRGVIGHPVRDQETNSHKTWRLQSPTIVTSITLTTRNNSLVTFTRSIALYEVPERNVLPQLRNVIAIIYKKTNILKRAIIRAYRFTSSTAQEGIANRRHNCGHVNVFVTQEQYTLIEVLILQQTREYQERVWENKRAKIQQEIRDDLLNESVTGQQTVTAHTSDQ